VCAALRWVSGHPDSASPLQLRPVAAAEHARRANDARLEARNVSACTLAALYGPTPADEAIEHCERLAAEGLSDRQAEPLVLASLAQLRAMPGEFERARELVRAARTLLDDMGIIVLAAATAMHWARIELLAGDLETAERELRQAEDTLTALREKYLLPQLTALLAQILYAEGRVDEAEETSRRAEELSAPDDVEAQALWRSVRAKVLARRNRAEDAERLAREAVRLMRTADAPDCRPTLCSTSLTYCTTRAARTRRGQPRLKPERCTS
jgi:ATP/maltotriose-dependent transcriptional regulator MalT